MKRIQKVVVAVVAIIVLILGSIAIVRLFDKYRNLAFLIDRIEKDGGSLGSAQIIEKPVSRTQPWRSIQEQVKDTVAQVFAQVVEYDILQPYRTPNQGASYGSAFFINSEGELLTNAHVIANARAAWIQIPSLGKRIIDVEIVGMSPERDLALLRLTPESLELVRQELGEVPYLPLGNSDLIRRADEVLALGYPLGQHSLKSTTGVISGREQNMIQMSAPINPGNSGGPLLNVAGEVIGINSSGIFAGGTQNVGYIIPINRAKLVLDGLHTTRLLRKPHLGVLYSNASDELADYFGNPVPGGCYVAEDVKGSPLYKAGVRKGDMMYEIDGHKMDVFAEMVVPWSEDKVSIIDYVGRLSVGDKVELVVYRNGVRRKFTVDFDQMELLPIRIIYPGYEDIDHVVVGGMVFTQLTLNHVHALGKGAPGLAKYLRLKNQAEPVVVVTHIFPNSQAYRHRAVSPGATVASVNGVKIKTLDELREALKKGAYEKLLVVRVTDNATGSSDDVPLALPMDKVLEDEFRSSREFIYPISTVVKNMIKMREDARQA